MATYVARKRVLINGTTCPEGQTVSVSALGLSAKRVETLVRSRVLLVAGAETQREAEDTARAARQAG